MKKFVQLTYIVIGLEVYDDGPTFLGVVRFQERGSIVCKQRRTEEAKTSVHLYL